MAACGTERGQSVHPEVAGQTAPTAATGSRPMGVTWLAALMVAWLSGVALQLLEPSLETTSAYAAGVAVSALAVGVALLIRRRHALALVLATAAAVLAGFSVTGLQASLRLADALASGLEGRDLVVTGVVASLPQKGPSGLRFRFDLDDASRRRVFVKACIPAERDPRRPHGNLNPDGFDYE